jgi:MFS transporter, MCT family, solute carrier family 16 (monocarboxylic acid transporters), member 3
MAEAIDIEKSLPITVTIATIPPSSNDSVSSFSKKGPLQDAHPPQNPTTNLGAWLQILAGFLTNAVAWGYPAMFGVYQAHYTSALRLPAADASWIGSLQTFLTYAVCVVSGCLADAGHARAVHASGSAVVVLATVAASFADRYWHLVAAQGALTGLGLGLLTAPPLTAIAAAFGPRDRRRSFAFAASTAGTSAGSALFPALVAALLPRVGLAWALRCQALVTAVLCGNAFFLLRAPTVAKVPGRKPGLGLGSWMDAEAFRDVPYAFFTVATFLIFWALYFGFFYVSLPSIYKRDSICHKDWKG